MKPKLPFQSQAMSGILVTEVPWKILLKTQGFSVTSLPKKYVNVHYFIWNHFTLILEF